MKTLPLNLTHCHFDDHYRFHSTMVELIEKHIPRHIGAPAAWSDYTALLLLAHEAIMKAHRHDAYRRLADADFQRELIFTSLLEMVAALTRHFDPEKRATAQLAHKLLLRCQKAAQKGYHHETRAIDHLLTITRDNHARLFEQLQLTDWMTELNHKNMAFAHIMEHHCPENLSQADIRIKQVRPLLDAAFARLCEHIQARILFDNCPKCLVLLNTIREQMRDFAPRHDSSAPSPARPQKTAVHCVN